MESFSNSIVILEKQVKQLIEMHARTLRENEAIKLSNQQIMVEKENQQVIIANLTEQLKTHKLAQTLSGAGDQDSRQVKIKINEYIREIDKCLALLNN